MVVKNCYLSLILQDFYHKQRAHLNSEISRHYAWFMENSHNRTSQGHLYSTHKYVFQHADNRHGLWILSRCSGEMGM